MNKLKLIYAGLLTITIACCSISNAQSYKWGNLPMGGGGFVSAVITCPTEKNLIYCRTDVGGAYRWIEATKSWIPLTDWITDNQVGFLGVEALAVDPSKPANVYMLVGIDYFNNGKTAILRSTNYGATFQYTEVTTMFKAHGNGKGRQNGERLAVDPNKGSILFCGSRRNGLFKSTDAGVTWQNVNFPVTTTATDNGICSIVFDKTTGTTGNATQTIYVGVSRANQSNVYVSKDGGTTWNPVAGQNTTYMPQRLVLATDGNLFITYGNGAGPNGANNDAALAMDKGSVMKYNTKTNTWSTISPIINGVNTAFGGVSVDASNPQHVMVTTINRYLAQPWGYGDRIFESKDGGTTWTDLIATGKVAMDNNNTPWIDGHAIHWAGSIEIDPFNPNRVFLTSGNGIFMTENLNVTKATWKFMVKGIEETVPDDIVSIPGGPVATVIGDYDGCVYTDVTQYTQTHKPGMGTTSGIAFASKKTNFLARVGKNMYYTNNSGGTWTASASLPTANSYEGRIAINADGTVILWHPRYTGNDAGSNDIYRTTNNGGTWTKIASINSNRTSPIADMVNATKFYIYDANNGNFYTSNDAGLTFKVASTINTGGQKYIRAVPGIEGDVWVPLQGNGLSRTKNSGTSFTKIPGISFCLSVGFGKAAPGKTFPAIYIWGKTTTATNNGLYRSDDEGATWIRINDDQHQFGGPGNWKFTIGDMNTYGRVYMSTAGRGIIMGELQATTPTCKTPNLGKDIIVCQPTQPNLYSQITDAGYTFSWQRNGAVLTNTTSSITVTQSGTYTVTAKTTSCSETDTIIVTINPIPTVTASSNSAVCTGSNLVLHATSAISYKWAGASAFTATVQNPTITIIKTTNSGSYTVTITDNNGCTNSSSTAVVINTTPTTPIITEQNSTLTSNAKIRNQWYENSIGILKGDTSQTFMPYTSGDYYTIVTINGCSSLKSNTINTTFTGLQDKIHKELVIYPNPATDVLYFTKNTNPQTIQIYSIEGKSVMHMQSIVNNQIDISNLSKGLYFISINHNNTIERIKFIKE